MAPGTEVIRLDNKGNSKYPGKRKCILKVHKSSKKDSDGGKPAHFQEVANFTVR